MVFVKKQDNLIEDSINLGYDAILVPMSIYNSMNSGFTYDIALDFPIVKELEGKTPYGDRRKYGTIVEVNTDIIKFIICYVHNGGYSKNNDIDNEYLEKCLKTINNKFKGYNISSPIIGGNTKIFNELCTDIDLYLYDFIQKDTKLEFFKKIAQLRSDYKNKLITSNEYITERSKIEWVRRNGHFKEMPKDYIYKPKSEKIG